MSRRRRFLMLLLLVGLPYELLSGGGILVVRKDSLATLGEVAECRLTPSHKVYLKETPTTWIIPIPLVIYFQRQTYPFKLRYYGSTRSGDFRVTDEKGTRWTSGFKSVVVVTDVKYYRKSHEEAAVHVGSWADIVIPEPGTWLVESKGYIQDKEEGRTELTFPTMTIEPTLHGRFSVHNALNYMAGGMMR